MVSPRRYLTKHAWLLAGLLALASAAGRADPSADSWLEAEPAQEKIDYRPKLAVSETAAPFLKHLEPGSDAFPLERQALELEARLRELSDAFRAGRSRAGSITRELLDPAFRGARLLPVDRAAAGRS